MLTLSDPPVALVYIGPADLPGWFADGAPVKVARTDLTVGGVRAAVGPGGDRKDWLLRPGEVGRVERITGNGWWGWQLAFSRGRYLSLHTASTLADLGVTRSR